MDQAESEEKYSFQIVIFKKEGRILGVVGGHDELSIYSYRDSLAARVKYS